MFAVACCACSMASCCVGQTVRCCGSAATVTASRASRLTYFIVFVVVTALAWLARDYAADMSLGSLSAYDGCDGREDRAACIGASTVLRLSFGNFLFHAVLGLALVGVQAGGSTGRAALQNDWWGLKLFVWAGTFAGMLFVPYDDVVAYGRFAMFASSLFIIVQVVLLIDLAFTWNETWVAKDETAYYRAILVATALLFSGAIAMLAVMYVYFGDAGCDLNKFFISFTLVLTVGFSILSVLPRIERGILPSAVVGFYITFLCFSALLSEEAESDDSCNGFDTNDSPTITAIGILVTIVSLAFSVSRVAVASDKITGGGGSAAVGGSATYKSIRDGSNDDQEAAYELTDEIDDERDHTVYSYSFFQMTFAVASCYMAMMLTNWSTEGTGSDEDSVWIKIGSQWLTAVLYVWTLIAPLVIPGRDFV